MKRKAVYAGTFDPPTVGHLWMIEQASRLFDELVVAVGVNPDKRPMFTVEERMDMLCEVTFPLPNIQVTSFVNQYLIHYAASVGSQFIVRGIRNGNDYEYEKAMRNINGDLCQDVTTIFLMPPREIAEVSSSVVKGLIGPEGWEKVVAQYLPYAVFKKLLSVKHTIWRNLKEHGASGDEKIFWEKTLLPYFDSQRAYHRWPHILDMLAEFYKINHLLNDPLAVEMAIWYHDIIYDPKANDNEEKSAESAREMIQSIGSSNTFGSRVAELILATKHNAIPLDADAQFLVDLDLVIFGKTEEEFDQYEESIRKEYGWVPWEQFAEGRLKILKLFLQRPHIYLTQLFRDKYENIARSNLEKSLSILQGK